MFGVIHLKINDFVEVIKLNFLFALFKNKLFQNMDKMFLPTAILKNYLFTV